MIFARDLIEFFINHDQVKVNKNDLPTYKKQNIFSERFIYKFKSSQLIRYQNGKAINKLSFNEYNSYFQLIENIPNSGSDKTISSLKPKLLIDDNRRTTKIYIYTYFIDNGYAQLFDSKPTRLFSSLQEPKQRRVEAINKSVNLVLKFNTEDIKNNSVNGQSLGENSDYENAYFIADYKDNKIVLFATFKKLTDGTKKAHGIYRTFADGKRDKNLCAMEGWEHQAYLYTGGLSYCRFFTSEDKNLFKADRDKTMEKKRERDRIEWEKDQEWLAEKNAREAEARRETSRSLAYEMNKATANFQRGINSLNAQTAYANQLAIAANRENLRKAYPSKGSSDFTYSSSSSDSPNSSRSSRSSSPSSSHDDDIATKKREEAKKTAEHDKKQNEAQLLAERQAKEELFLAEKKAEEDKMLVEERDRQHKLEAGKLAQERQLKAEKEAKDKLLAEQLFLANTANNANLFAKKCPDGEGHYYVVGTRPRSNSDPIACVNIHYSASCPGSRNFVTGIGKNFTGLSTGCFTGDTYKISEKLPCDVDQVIVTATKADKCF